MFKRKIDKLKTDSSINSFTFCKSLNRTQRSYIRTQAIKAGMFSKSTGSEPNRRVCLSRGLMNAKREKIFRRLHPQYLDLQMSTKLGMYLMKREQDMEAEYEKCRQSGRQDSSNALEPINVEAARRVNFWPLRPSQTKRFPSHFHQDQSGTLPVHRYKEKILELVEKNQVVVISGDTGCGKSTQIPQFLLDDAIASGKESSTRIICTQPRRLSAISLAARVRQERNCATKEIGHAVRFEACYDARTSKLIFCTIGTLLRWLNRDPEATSFSHLIIDEAH
uniref:DEAD/DEAH box RNA helicase putative n=1 Tax=Albugo laibachii Nc14 TaxID=890382 RepID=F0WBZ5_9STRA|nr:DEAD/DEAH box RNA helicase putative [Albugo laibachii Nc14]|eukprot:CCA18676.1 DEAD/DEAH box RNA helicase putative [Albugo laibachii Nc14]